MNTRSGGNGKPGSTSALLYGYQDDWELGANNNVRESNPQTRLGADQREVVQTTLPLTAV